MGVSIIVTRSIDKSFQKTNLNIDQDEWKNIVERAPNLRLRQNPIAITNPKTRESIKIQPSPADSEIQVLDEWLPFLGFRRGELVMRYLQRFENEADPIRVAIADIANRFDAIIMHDAGDEILLW